MTKGSRSACSRSKCASRLIAVGLVVGFAVVITGGAGEADIAICGDTDDLFWDAKRRRLYVSCGEGLVDVVEQTSADHYQTLGRITTAAGARTSFYSPELDRYFVAVPERGNQQAQIRIFQPE